MTIFLTVLKIFFNRSGAYYDHGFFTEHGVAILEDLVITLAEGAASMYLELISVDSRVSNEMNSLGLSLCTLSTRELQKLRNEVKHFSNTSLRSIDIFILRAREKVYRVFTPY